MEGSSHIKQPAARGYVLAALFLLVGLGSLADWLYGTRAELSELLKGLGFVLMAPDAHLNPVNLSAPLRTLLRPQPSPNTNTNRVAQYVAMAGFALVITGLIVRWL